MELCLPAVPSLPRGRSAGAPGDPGRRRGLGDGRSWLLVGASPDLRQQMLATAALAPRAGSRHSPIAGVVLLERRRRRHRRAARAARAAAASTCSRRRRSWTCSPPIRCSGCSTPRWSGASSWHPASRIDCGGGLALTLLPMPGKVPLYLEDRAAAAPEAGAAYAARIEAGGRSVVVAPACAAITETVLATVSPAPTRCSSTARSSPTTR